MILPSSDIHANNFMYWLKVEIDGEEGFAYVMLKLAGVQQAKTFTFWIKDSYSFLIFQVTSF